MSESRVTSNQSGASRAEQSSPTSQSSRSTAWFVWLLVLALLLLHQDFWFWGDRTLVFGFLPIGLAYHAGFSLAASAVWALAVRFAWPLHIEEWADEFDDAAGLAGAHKTLGSGA